MDLSTLLSAIVSWVEAESDVVGVALVGSYARDASTKASDVDLIILTNDVGKYFQHKEWLVLFGEVEKCRVEHWGRVKTLRAFYVDGPEIEYNFVSPDWASLPVDSGTGHVIEDGMRILYDPKFILDAIRPRPSSHAEA